MINDVIIIGGGAAGLCAAVYLKKNNPSLSVRIIEAQTRVGKKLALTGNGRCNISNANIDLSRFHGENVEFCRYALEKYNLNFTESFFASIGVPFYFEKEKAFPESRQAPSVVDCLRFSAEEYGVIINLETKVTNIQVSGNNYKIMAENMSFTARNVIIASGLYSGGDRLGCNGSMLNILKKAGFKTIKTAPAIVQLKTVTDVVKQLKGIKIDALVTVKIKDNKLRSEFGEVLFTDYGLSGPPVLQVSRCVSTSTEETLISLDLMMQHSFSSVCQIIEERSKILANRNLDEFFTGMFNKRLGQVILKLAGCELNNKASDLDSNKCKRIASIIKDFSFKVTGTTGFNNSQVTAGGLDTNQFNNFTMQSKTNAGLYAVGEILDIDGDCGGFNLQWAWSSSMCAADDILRNKK